MASPLSDACFFFLIVNALRADSHKLLAETKDKACKNNRRIAKKSGAKYFGTFPLRDFIGLVSLTDIVVTQVTFALHVAIGLKKKVVLMNNIFNKNEYYFYGLEHKILEPEVPCKMCYKSKFDENCYVKNCMELIKVEDVFNAIEELSDKHG